MTGCRKEQEYHLAEDDSANVFKEIVNNGNYEIITLEDSQSFKTLIHQRVKCLRWASTFSGPPSKPPYCPFGPTLARFPPAEDSNIQSSPLSASRIAESSPEMPHAVSMPQTGFQALILCGPGVSLNTFTSVPSEHPKALIPIANRPMVWYALDWCYRTGITNITLITSPQSQSAIAAALAQNPYLTSLPSPSADIISPAELNLTTGTAELLRLPEVQSCIVSDFFLLPCDLVCDVPGATFLETWMTTLAGLGGVTDGTDIEVSGPKMIGLGGEKGGRRGGLAVYYPTTNREESVKGEECDFVCTAKLDADHVISNSIAESLDTQGTFRKLVWAMPMDSLRDECEEHKAWNIRSSLLQRHGSVKCLTTFRDSHTYLLPYWVKDFAKLNEDFESVSEDLVGTWAKAEWRKPAYRARYHVKDIFNKPWTTSQKAKDYYDVPIEEEIDLLSLSSTQTTRYPPSKSTPQFASRVSKTSNDFQKTPGTATEEPPLVPPMLAYLHSTSPTAPLIRRVDNTPLLLSVSLLLAKLPASETTSNSSPLSHQYKTHPTATIAARTTISTPDTLIGPNVSVAEKCVIKECVIGSSVTIGQGSRLTRCVIMDGATVGEKCMLTGTVVGKKAVVGPSCDLRDCEVQDGMGVGVRAEGDEDAAVEAKGEKFMIGGFEDDDGIDDGDDLAEDGGGLSLS